MEKGRHSRESGNPELLIFPIKSMDNALDPRSGRDEENPNTAINKFNNLQSYLSAYGVYPRQSWNATWY